MSARERVCLIESLIDETLREIEIAESLASAIEAFEHAEKRANESDYIVADNFV